MKNKVKKIILSIVIFILLVVISLPILIIKNIIPNPFLDTSDLVCIMGRMEPDVYTHQNVVTIKFNKKAIVKDIKEEGKYTFHDSKTATLFYEEFRNSIGANYKEIISLDDKILTVKINSTDATDDMKKMLKKEIKIKYEEFGYECK